MSVAFTQTQNLSHIKKGLLTKPFLKTNSESFTIKILSLWFLIYSGYKHQSEI